MAEPGSPAEVLIVPPTKIAGRYLAPCVYAREPAAAPEGFVDLEVPLETTMVER